jgi:NADP-dependent 3-hydroxy acid dehydrogenase YdfG
VNDPAFKDKVVIITGGSSGIGRELARQLADHGAWLALAARNVENLEAANVESQKRGGKAIAIPTDVSSQVLCADAVKRTVEEFGLIDVLVNNAGITMWGNFDAINDLGILTRSCALTTREACIVPIMPCLI